MCLKSRTAFAKETDADITCYKVLIVRDGKYSSPTMRRQLTDDEVSGREPYAALGAEDAHRMERFRHSGSERLKFNEVHGDPTREERLKALAEMGYEGITDYSIDDVVTVHGGFIHTFAMPMVATDPAYAACFECVIPKGTRHYVSISGNQYASKEVRIVRRLTASEVVEMCPDAETYC